MHSRLWQETRLLRLELVEAALAAKLEAVMRRFEGALAGACWSPYKVLTKSRQGCHSFHNYTRLKAPLRSVFLCGAVTFVPFHDRP